MREDAGQIVVSGLTKRFGGVTAVDDLSFIAAPGSVTGFLAPNAATATIGGRNYSALPSPGRAAGVVLEAAGFHPARTGRDHLRVYCTACGYPPRRADEVLQICGLAAAGRRKVGGYSLGMRQRLALAAALLGDPAALILDEPANGLDPEGIAWLRGLLRDYARSGRTVLYSSHVLPEVELLADQVVIISRGRLVRHGT